MRMLVLSALLLLATASYGAPAVDSWEEKSPQSKYLRVSSPLQAIEELADGKSRMSLHMAKFAELQNKIAAGHKHITLTDLGVHEHELHVTPFEVFTQDAVLETDNGRFKIPKPEMIFLRGKVAGYDDSFVTLHIGKHSSFGLVQAAGRTWQLGTSPKMPHAHSILTEIKAGDEEQKSQLEAIDEELSYPIQPPKSATAAQMVQTKARATVDDFAASGSQDQVLTLAIECDKACRDLFQASGECLIDTAAKVPGTGASDKFEELPHARRLMGSSDSSSDEEAAAPTEDSPDSGRPSGDSSTSTSGTSEVAGCSHPAATYLASVIAGASTIYSKDVGVTLQIQYMKVWSGASPYDQGTASLEPFKVAYTGAEGTKDADIAHLFTGLVEGGLAYVGTACNNQGYNTGVSSIRGTWQNSLEANAYNWDVIVTAHEMGHNVGSGHTHDSSSYNPTIDSCVSSSGQTASRGSAQCVRGTIMSYCHLCGGTANVDMRLDTQVQEVVKDRLNGGSCNLNSL